MSGQATSVHVRAATPADVDAIVGLNVTAFGAQDEADVRAFLAEPAIRDAWSVVEDGGRIVSSIARIDHRMQLDGLEFTGAQIEYVVTDPDYQRRGLIAAQMDWHHRACEAEGVPAQFIGGIPYFYRRFGYGYGLDSPAIVLFDPPAVRAMPVGNDNVRVRVATADDLPAILRLERERPTSGLRVIRDARSWERAMAMCQPSDHAHLLVAEEPDGVVGWAKVFDHPNESRAFLMPSVARTAAAVAALVREALDLAGEHMLIGFDSPGMFGERLRAMGATTIWDHGYYTRIADPLAFLDFMRPLLDARLRTSDLAQDSGTLEMSFYTTGAAIDYERGEVKEVRGIPGVEDPTDTEGIGIAPDWFPALVFGRFGAAELARRVDDVFIARDRHLMNVLFPQRPSDVTADF
jgi:predicted N-acetyltransferase YhbS